MSKTITFFNNKGRVGKTTMVYHLAWMLAEMGRRVVAIDIDPQSTLSSMFLEDDRLAELMLNEENRQTILNPIVSIAEGERCQPVHIEEVNDSIGLVVGDVELSAFEGQLSDAWLKCFSGDPYAFSVTSVFDTIIKDVTERWEADVVVIDVGPNLGAINRAVMVSTDYIIMPVASDLFSLQGIKNLGKTLKAWHQGWQQRVKESPKPGELQIPNSPMHPCGYVVMQYSAQNRHPIKVSMNWADRISKVYREYVLEEPATPQLTVSNDPHCIGLLKHYHSLAPMAMEARKPIFLLKPADGAIGAHLKAVQNSYSDFETITGRILELCHF